MNLRGQVMSPEWTTLTTNPFPPFSHSTSSTDSFTLFTLNHFENGENGIFTSHFHQLRAPTTHLSSPPVPRAHQLPSSPTMHHQAAGNYFTEMCSGSEAGSYLRLIDVVYHSTLGSSVIKKKKGATILCKNSKLRKLEIQASDKPSRIRSS